MCKITRIFAILLLTCSILVLSFSGTQAEKETLPYDQLMSRLESLTPGETIEVRMGTEKKQYDFGDALEVRFQTSKDCYIVLMDISSPAKDSIPGEAPPEESITFLLPNYQFPDIKIEGNRVYSTLHDFNMNITVAPPKGHETLNLFCSAQKVEFFDADFNNEPFYAIAHNDQERIEILADHLNQLKNHEWAGNSVQIQIGPVMGLSRGIRKKGALNPIGSTGTTGKFFPPLQPTGTTGKR